MIKIILSPFDGSPAAERALALAGDIAKDSDTRIDGLFVINTHRYLTMRLSNSLLAGTGVTPWIEVPKDPEDLLKEEEQVSVELKEHRESFRNILKARGATGEFHYEIGEPTGVLINASAAADLVAVGRRGSHRGVEYLGSGETVHALARSASCPVLVAGDSDDAPARVIFACDGSAHSIRALRAAAELALKLGITGASLFTVAESKEMSAEIQAGAKRYLERYGFMIESVTKSGKVVEELAEFAAAHTNPIIALGTYGQRGWRERIFGTTTSALIEDHGFILLISS